MADCRERRLIGGMYKPVLSLAELGDLSDVMETLQPCDKCRDALHDTHSVREAASLEMSFSQMDFSKKNVQIQKAHRERSGAYRLYKSQLFTFYYTTPAAQVQEAENAETAEIESLVSELKYLLQRTEEYAAAVAAEREAQADAALCMSNQLYEHLITPKSPHSSQDGSVSP